MALITTGSHPKLLWPGLWDLFGQKYNEYPPEWSEIFTVEKSSKNYEEIAEMTTFGYAPVKTEGGSVFYDTDAPGPLARFTHVAYALGWIITREAMDDNQYMEVGRRRTTALAFSMKQTKEVVHANVLNRAFNSSYVGADGKELVATDHPSSGGNLSNELTTTADLSESSLEDAWVQIADFRNARGMRMAAKPWKLVVGPGQAIEAFRLLNSELQPNQTGNNINAVRAMGLIPGGVVVNHYLTDPDAWFILTDVPGSLIHFTRTPVEFTQDNDFDTLNKKAKAYERYSAGWADWRGIFGSAGA